MSLFKDSLSTWVQWSLNGYSDDSQRGCVTPKQLESLHDVLEGDVDMFDGYEELPNDCQEKVKRALENGHVDDEDWKGVMFPCP